MKQHHREQLLETIGSVRKFATAKDVPSSDLKTWRDFCFELCSIDAQMLPAPEIDAIAKAADNASADTAKRARIFDVATLALIRPGALIQADRGSIFAAARLIYDEAAAELDRR